MRVPTTHSLRQGPEIVHKVHRVDTRRPGKPRPCAKEIRHQDHFLVIDKMLAAEAFKDSDNDRLPVVELRPFVKKEWRPSKSLPDPDMERRSLGALRSAMSSRSLDFESIGYPNPEKQMTLTPRVYEGLSHKTFIGQAERRTQHPPLKETKDMYVEYDTWRGRERFMEHPEGFVSKLDREKSTLEEVRNGSSVCTQYSCLKRAMTEVDLRNQQSIQVNGKKIDNLPPRVSSMYGDIHEYYRLTKSYTMAPSDAQQSEDKENKRVNSDVLDDMRIRMDGIQTSYLDQTIYDAFDRSSTLPSIQVRKAAMKKRRLRPQNPDSESSSRKSSSKRAGESGYRLGVTNSLHLMSHIGRPVNVEQKLSHDLRITLDSLRRSKDATSIISGAYKIIPRYEAIPKMEEYRMNSTIQPTISRFGPDSRQNTQSNRNQYMSRASTYLRSDIMDSGIESTGGYRSPIKPMSRNVSSRLHAKKHAMRDESVPASKPIDARGYASSDASKISGRADDIDALFDRVNTPEATRDQQSSGSQKPHHIATIPTDTVSVHEEPQPLNPAESNTHDDKIEEKETAEEIPDERLDSASSSSVSSQEAEREATPKETPREHSDETHEDLSVDAPPVEDNPNPEDEDTQPTTPADSRIDKKTFVTQQPSTESFSGTPTEQVTSRDDTDGGALEEDINDEDHETQETHEPQDNISEKDEMEKEDEEDDGLNYDDPAVSTLIPRYIVD